MVGLSALAAAPAGAHYEHPEDRQAAQTARKAQGSDTAQAGDSDQHDPWKLLEMAMSPAYAASTNVHITISGAYRIITSNGIPDHQTGAFPNSGNPNRISEQRYLFRVALHPEAAASSTAIGMYPFGVAINGIPFDPSANEWWHRNPRSGWQYEAMTLGPRLGLDQNNAHVQPNGAYHYHGLPVGLVNKIANHPKPLLLGYAADGFPIYGPYGHSDPADASSQMVELKSSYRLKPGQRPGARSQSGLEPGGSYDGSFVQDWEFVEGVGNLDECNGRFGVTAEYPEGIYHYIITTAYPYIPRRLKGQADPTFYRHGHIGPPAGGRGQPGRLGRPGGGFGPPPGWRPPPGTGPAVRTY